MHKTPETGVPEFCPLSKNFVRPKHFVRPVFCPRPYLPLHGRFNKFNTRSRRHYHIVFTFILKYLILNMRCIYKIINIMSLHFNFKIIQANFFHDLYSMNRSPSKFSYFIIRLIAPPLSPHSQVDLSKSEAKVTSFNRFPETVSTHQLKSSRTSF